MSLSELNDDDIPPAAPDRSAGDAKPRVKPVGTKEIEKESDLEQPLDPTNPTNLTQMMRLRPFLAYFRFLASHRYNQKRSDHARFEALRAEHPRFYWVCIGLDVGLIVALVGLLLTAASVSMYKTIIL